MASLGVGLSSVLEEHGAPAASNGGGGSVSHGEGTLAGKIDEVKAYKHQGAWRRLTAVRVVDGRHWVALSTVSLKKRERELVGGRLWCTSWLGDLQNGFIDVCRG